MNTPAILNPAISSQGAQGAKPPVKQSDAPSSDTSFNSMLTREIADRAAPRHEDQAGPKETGNTSASNPTPPKAADKTGPTGAKDKAHDKDDVKKVDDSAAAASTPAEMLAMLGLNGVQAVDKTDHVRPDLAALKVEAKPPVAIGKTDLKAEHGRTVPEAKPPVLAEKTDQKPEAAKPAAPSRDLQGLAAKENAASDSATDTAPVQKDHAFAAEMDRAREPKQEPGPDAAAKAGNDSVQSATAAANAADAAAAKIQDAQPTPSINALTSVQQTAAMQGAAGITDRLTPRVGSPGWDQALAQKITWMVAGEHQSASLTLNPPDLGPLQVVLNVSNSQAVATFTAAQPEVRQALEAALPKLREMMSEAGIQLGQATVGTGTPNQSGSFGEASRQGSRPITPAAAVSETTVPVPRGRTISSGQGIVDTFV